MLLRHSCANAARNQITASTPYRHPVLKMVRHIAARRVPNRMLPVPKFEKRLDAVIMGAPNAGKSVLLNALVETKLAAATRKRHTTRGEILGVFNHRNVQLAFYDTPGFVDRAVQEKADTRTLRAFTTESASKADVVLLVVDSLTCR